MAIPFIAGVIVGAVGFYAYKNKDNLKGKSKELLKIVKQKSESVKKYWYEWKSAVNVMSKWIYHCSIKTNQVKMGIGQIVNFVVKYIEKKTKN